MIRFAQTHFLLTLAIFGLIGLSSVEIKAQAPGSIGGQAAILQVTSGTAPLFANAGSSFRFLPSATDNTYGVIGLSGNAASGYGTYSYSKTGTTTGTISYSDVPSGISGFAAALTFTSPNAGSYLITNPSYPSASETGTFTLFTGPAPNAVLGWKFQLLIDAGLAPYATSGSAQLVAAVSGNSYQITGESGNVTNSSGTYVYATYPQNSPAASSLTLNDSVLGSEYTQTLSWQSTTNGAYVVRDVSTGGYQTGTFTGTPPSTYTVTPTAGANGSISPSSAQTVVSGGSLTFTATPYTGYGVVQWLVNGSVMQTGGNSFTVNNITAATTVQVIFLAIPIITSGTTATATYGIPFGGYTIVASGAPTSFGTSALPFGLSMNNAGVISGTPSQTGTFNVVLFASNAAGRGAATLTLTISKATQSIDFTPVGNQVYPGSPVTLSAIDSSGLTPITFSNISGPATVSGNILTSDGTGLDTIQASQAGNTNYLAATQQQSFLITSKYLSFSQWEAQTNYFSTQQQTNTVISGSTATPQNDGVPNLLKYLYDINPAHPMSTTDRAALPVLSMGTTGDAYTTFDPPGSTFTQPTAISGSNIVGWYEATNAIYQGFLYDGGSYTTLNPPGSTSSQATGVSGTNVVGWYTQTSTPTNSGFIYNGSGYTALNPPGSSYTYPTGISGTHAVGWYQGTNGVYQGFLYDGSTFTSLNPPGSVHTQATAVSGTNVVGWYQGTNGTAHGFLYNGSGYSTFDPTNSYGTHPTAIDGTNIVGNYLNLGAFETNAAFLYSGSSYTLFGSTNGFVYATGVSGSNVVGYYENADNQAFLYDGQTSVPIDPSTNAISQAAGIDGNNIVGSYQGSYPYYRHGYLYQNGTANPVLTLTYRQNAQLTEITINVQTSPDLQNWTTLVKSTTLSSTTYTIQQTGTDTTTQDPIMQVQVLPNGSASQFIRLNVTQP